jgi:hypothetical protein
MTRFYGGTRYVMKITPVEPGHRIQLTADWAAELGLEHIAALEKTAEGILVRPCHTATWDEILADKLPMGQEISSLDLSDVSSDDLLL